MAVKLKSLAIVPVYKEAEKVGKVLEKFDANSIDEICLVIDNPDDRLLEEIRNATAHVMVQTRIIQNPERKGIGHAIKQGYRYALAQNYELIVVMAGNGKDDPKEIPRITSPIINDGYDYVQGSRFLPGSRRERNPILRRIFTRLFPILWTWSVGVRCTDVTNGFRAYRVSVLKDPRINVWQQWLDGYELEYYLHYKALTLGYKFVERPVSKIYPAEKKGGYTKISPLRDWWQIIGPLVLLRLGARS